MASSARRRAPSKSGIRTCSTRCPRRAQFRRGPFVMSGGVMYKGDLVAAPKSSRRPRLERRRLRGAAVTSPSSCEARRRFLVTGSTPLYAATLMYVNYSERYSRTAFAPSLSSQHRVKSGRRRDGFFLASGNWGRGASGGSTPSTQETTTRYTPARRLVEDARGDHFRRRSPRG